jgi:hypothetical protein
MSSDTVVLTDSEKVWFPVILLSVLGAIFAFGYFVHQWTHPVLTPPPSACCAPIPPPIIWKVTAFGMDCKEIETFYCNEGELECGSSYVRIAGDDGKAKAVIFGNAIATRLTPAEAQDYEQNKDRIKIK